MAFSARGVEGPYVDYSIKDEELRWEARRYITSMNRGEKLPPENARYAVSSPDDEPGWGNEKLRFPTHRKAKDWLKENGFVLMLNKEYQARRELEYERRSRAIEQENLKDPKDRKIISRFAGDKMGARRQAKQDQFGDMGDETEIFHTDSLPQTGHDEAIDDDQQEIRAASKELVKIAGTVRKVNPALSRRLSVLANNLFKRYAEIGIHQGKTPNFNEDFSTAVLESPDQDGKAVDDSDTPHELQFFGFEAPDKDQVGPRKRASSRRAGVVVEVTKSLNKIEAGELEDLAYENGCDATDPEKRNSFEFSSSDDATTFTKILTKKGIPHKSSVISSRKAEKDRQYLQDLDFPEDTYFDEEPDHRIEGDVKSSRRRATEEEVESEPTGVITKSSESKPKSKKKPQIESVTMKFHRDSARRRANPDPLPEYKERMDKAMDDLDEDTYESQESQFHELLDEIKELEEMASEAVTTGMQYASRRKASIPSKEEIESALNKIGSREEAEGYGTLSVSVENSGPKSYTVHVDDSNWNHNTASPDGVLELMQKYLDSKGFGEIDQLPGGMGWKISHSMLAVAASRRKASITATRVDEVPPAWLKKHGYSEEDWHEAVSKAEAKGLLKTDKEFGVVVGIMKNMKKKKQPASCGIHDTVSKNRSSSTNDPVLKAAKQRSAKIASRKASTTQVSAWEILKNSLTRMSRVGGRWASGAYELRTEDYGQALDLHVNTQDESGAPLIASTVTFSLVRDDPKSRTATIEVNDGVIHKETRELTLDSEQAKRYASEWVKETEKAAKSILNGGN